MIVSSGAVTLGSAVTASVTGRTYPGTLGSAVTASLTGRTYAGTLGSGIPASVTGRTYVLSSDAYSLRRSL